MDKKDIENKKTGGADLHLHTTFSDGSYSPSEVVQKAANLGFEVISITDHDTIEGIAEAVESGLQYGVEVIPGIELSCTYKKEDIHILGYFIDYKERQLRDILYNLSRLRIKRMKQIIDKLNTFDLNIDKDLFFEKVNAASIGRLHLAHYMVKKKMVGSVYEAFERYIGDGKPAYIEVNAFSLEKGISFITENGGIAVYAHPGKTNRDKLIRKMIKMGIRGIEVFHTGHSRETTSKYIKIAVSKGLLITGGSDCHGLRKLEHLIGKIRLPIGRVAQLKNEYSKNQKTKRQQR